MICCTKMIHLIVLTSFLWLLKLGNLILLCTSAVPSRTVKASSGFSGVLKLVTFL